MKSKNKELLNKVRPVIGLVVFSIIISFMSDRFLTVNNLFNVFRQTSINAIIAIGMTFVILTSGIDLSVGSTLAFSSAVAAYLLANGYNIFLVILVALAIGFFAGCVNGIFIAKGKIQPFIATLAMMQLLRGATLVFTNGKPIAVRSSEVSPVFAFIGRGNVMGIHVPIIITIIVLLIAHFLLKYTKFGRYVYAIGGNEESSVLSGINVDKVKISTYAISGLLSALVGLIVISRLSSAQPTAGVSYEMDAIAAVVLGGTTLSGGQGSVLGTLIGALIIGLLNNALNLMDVQSYYQMIAKAIVILIAVLLDRKTVKD
jgi:ribose transport system permease protein